MEPLGRVGVLVVLLAGVSACRPGADDGGAREAPRGSPAAEPQGNSRPAPPTGAVRVVVRDMAGEPVPGVRVVVRPPRPKTFGHWPGTDAPSALTAWRSLPPSWDLAAWAEATTTADGSATLAVLPRGACAVTVDSPGRVRRSVPATVGPAPPVEEVVIVAEVGHALVGNVTTGAGVPIADAVVVAEYPAIAPDGRCDAIARDFAVTRSDAEGRYRFDALPATSVAIRCGVQEAWSSHGWTVHVPAIAEFDLPVVARGPIAGVVVGAADGKPIAGAAVVFTVETWHSARVTAQATTDAEGRYTIPVYPGETVREIAVTAPGWWHRPAVTGGLQPPCRLDGPGAAVFDLALRADTPENALVRGVVRGPDGPVAGAEVWLHGHDVLRWFSEKRTTDAAGRFWFMDAPAQRLDLSVDRVPGLYQPGAARTFDSDGPPSDPAAPCWIAADAVRPVDRDIVLARGGRTAGRVSAGWGPPGAGAAARTRDGIESTSGDDGSFALEGLAEPARTQVWARSPQGTFQGESASVVAGAGADVEGVEVRIRPVPRLADRVATGRAVVPDAAVSLRGAYVELGGAWVPLSPTGAFRLELEARSYPTGATLRVVVPAFGEGGAEVAWPAEGGAVDAGEVAVSRRAARIRGRVTNSEGRTVAGAMVRVEAEPEHPVIGCRFDEVPEPPIEAVTGADGGFEVAGLTDGYGDVRVSAAGYVEEEAETRVWLDDDVAECSVELSRAAPLRGRAVHTGGRPAAGARVEVRREDGSEFGPLDASAITDAEGAFDVQVRADATYTVEVSPVFARVERFLATTSGPHTPGARPIVITIDAGQRIAGRVLDPEGRGVHGVRVSCGCSNDGAALATLTAADGTFEVTALPAGAYDVRVTRGLDDVVVARDVAAGRTDVEFRIDAPSTIEGVLVDEKGDPAAQWRLIAAPIAGDDDADDAWIEAVTDDAGRFRLVGAGSSACRIELLRENGFGDLHLTWPLIGGAPVSPGATDVVLRVASATETTISGRVVDDSGQPFNGLTVVIETPSLGPGGQRRAHPGASFEQDGLRLDTPCALVAVCAGFRWTLAVPAGTTDLVLTAGADGLHRAEFGGHALAAGRLQVAISAPEGRFFLIDEIRLVRVATGEMVVDDRVQRTQYSDHAEFDFAELPLGVYRVEARRDSESEWVPCRAGLSTAWSEPVLVIDEEAASDR